MKTIKQYVFRGGRWFSNTLSWIRIMRRDYSSTSLRTDHNGVRIAVTVPSDHHTLNKDNDK
jgi:hypothetical protein